MSWFLMAGARYLQRLFILFPDTKASANPPVCALLRPQRDCHTQSRALICCKIVEPLSISNDYLVKLLLILVRQEKDIEASL